MMVSVETYLLRGKRLVDRWSARPEIRTGGRLLLYGGGAMVMSAAPVWGQMQPLAAAMVTFPSGADCAAAALGGMLGYHLFWGNAGVRGMVWVLGALVLSRIIRAMGERDRVTPLTAAAMALMVSMEGLVYQLWLGDRTSIGTYLLRIAAAGVGTVIYMQLPGTQERVILWIVGGMGVLGLAGIRGVPWINFGCLAAGILAAASPLPAAALAGAGLEAAGHGGMTAGMCFASLLRMAPIPDRWRRLGAPAAGCLLAMVLWQRFDPVVLIWIAAGGWIGAVIPWHFAVLPRRTGTATAQVRLEETARVMNRLQRQLLETPPVALDRESVLARLRENACGDCSHRSACAEKETIGETLLREPLAWNCRKRGRILREVRRAQDQLRFLEGEQKRRGELRRALAAQYGILAGYLRLTADRLPLRERASRAKYHIQVAARSASRERADGDRCMAFAGTGFRYYILLCDGMGTGFGAAEAARAASTMLRQMLRAGLPARYALGSMNNSLALRGFAGEVTVDLAEVRLDTGQARILKWGAARSLLIRRGRAENVGDVTMPPGMAVGERGENESKLSLARGETLVMLSDGAAEELPGLAERSADVSPGELAEYIVRESGEEDDATAVVIRLQPLANR